MVFNHVTEFIRRWTVRAVNRYQEEWRRERENCGRSLRMPQILLISDMSVEITSLVDVDMASFNAYTELVRDMWNRLTARALDRAKEPEELTLLEQTDGEFRAFLDSVEPSVEDRAAHYFRLILGPEREAILHGVRDAWGYDQSYWYPLSGGFDGDKLFFSEDRLEPYRERLTELLGLPEAHIYECGEADFSGYDCAEVDDLYGYGGTEVAYVPKDLGWIIYFSHENTVTFAGTILAQVKELLAGEREHWNKWE